MGEGGPAIQMPMPQNMLESEMIGAIKIKDGLFIGDELASTVSPINRSLFEIDPLTISITKRTTINLVTLSQYS